MTLSHCSIIVVLSLAASSWAQAPAVPVPAVRTDAAVYSFLVEDGNKQIACVVSWDVSDSKTWFEPVKPDPGIDVTLSKPAGEGDAIHELMAAIEARGEPWRAGEPTVVMSEYEINAAAGMNPLGTTAILPALHPGSTGQHGGRSFRAADYPRWMPWSTSRLLAVDKGRFLLIADTPLRATWSIPRAYLIESPQSDAIKPKSNELLIRRRLNENPFLKLPDKNYSLRSVATLGDQVFVSAGAGWIARLDTKRMVWANVWQPLGPVVTHIGSDRVGLRAIVERRDGTFEEHKSTDGVNWTLVRPVAAPPAAVGLWRFTQGAWYFLERRATSAGVDVGSLDRLGDDGKWSVAYQPDAQSHELVMDWGASVGAGSGGITILTGIPVSAGGPFTINVRNSVGSIGSK